MEMEGGILDAHNSLRQGIPFKGIFYETVFHPTDADLTFVAIDSFFQDTDFYKNIKNAWLLRTKILQDGSFI